MPRQAPGDLERLLALLNRLDARFRPVRADRDIAPDASHLAGEGQLNLITQHGPLDILLRLHDTRGYDQLLPHSREIVDADLRVRLWTSRR